MPELTALTALRALLHVLTDRARTGGPSRGSVTLEQVAIAAGLLAIAIGAVAVIGAVVAKYTGKLN